MDRVIARDVRFYVGGDRQRVNHIDTPDSEITFKHILLPVWWAAYKYRGKRYRFVVNARGSSSEGKPPIPHRKLLLTLFLGYALRLRLATNTPPIKEDDMRALLQRVNEAEVKVDGQQIGATDAGLLILICAMAGDTQAVADQLINKITKLRIFNDDAGKMNKSIMETSGSALVISQFTLAADTKRGNRPGFSNAAPPDEGLALYEYFAAGLARAGVPVETGQFGADMQVSLINDGPVTIWLDTAEGK